MGKWIAAWKIAPGSDPVEAPEIASAGNIDEITARLPGGYTTFRTFGKFRVLRLGEHFARLEETARLAGRPITLDRAAITAALHRALEAFPAEEARARLALDLEQSPGTVYLLLQTLRVPDEEAYQNGVRVVTRRLQRQNPKAKLTGFLKTAASVRQELPDGIHEVVMVSADGELLEGLSSNFFAVKAGELWTAEEGVLSGITRQLVLEAARLLDVKVNFAGVMIDEVGALEEAFITSAGRAVLPVVEIDGQRIGDGRPGAVTRRLSEQYWKLVEKELDFV